MAHKKTGIVLSLALAITSSCSMADVKTPPNSYVDEGACPFECCEYGEWRSSADTQLRKAASSSAPVVGIVAANENIIAITGKVITSQPGLVNVLREHSDEFSGVRFKPGDKVYVYTYLGEGIFKVWHNGKMMDTDASFLLHDVGGWVRCAEEDSCWGQGTLPSLDWWVNIKTEKGLSGWSDQAENFVNKGSCG